jgi:hypothetical protein
MVSTSCVTLTADWVVVDMRTSGGSTNAGPHRSARGSHRSCTRAELCSESVTAAEVSTGGYLIRGNVPEGTFLGLQSGHGLVSRSTELSVLIFTFSYPVGFSGEDRQLIMKDHDGPGVVPRRCTGEPSACMTGRRHSRWRMSRTGRRRMGWRAGSAQPQPRRHGLSVCCWSC